jgi:hypothetical protein
LASVDGRRILTEASYRHPEELNANRMTALALVAAGLLLIVAGPLLPGGERVSSTTRPAAGT